MSEAVKEYARIEAAANFIKSRIGNFSPTILAILGSGLGHYAQSENVKSICEIPYSEIPDMPVSTVSGHVGKFVFGYVGDVPVMFMQGRIHLYEGYPVSSVVFPIRVAAVLGVRKLVLTNAAGGVNLSFKPGDFMIISDHISSFVPSPLKGENIAELGTRFPDMSSVYSARMQNIIAETANEAKIEIKKGVYLQASGPQYETPAEIRMMRTLGADAVGMSTVVEATAARHAGMEICGVSCITNMAAGILNKSLSHSEVREIADKSEKSFSKIMTEIILKF